MPTQLNNTILFVDDNEVCHELANLLFKSSTSFNVINAYCGMEALNIAKRFRGELGIIILDVMLPDINGFEVYNLLKKDEYLVKVPVLFQSGLDIANENYKFFFKDDNVGIIHKPYKQMELLDAIKKLMFPKI